MGDLPSTIGAYRVVRRLGEGGMGAVYEAVHEAIERRVAIKVLHPEFARNDEFTGRFFNEARAVNRVEHPGLVQISDFGKQSDGTAYIVMELLKGESLSHRLSKNGGKLPTAEVVQLSWQIADALAAAHAKDIVHRDLKPENIMLVPEPHMPGGERTKLLDFGIAKVADQGQGEGPRVQTKTDQFFGTPIYMSPEQCEGAGRVDAKSDVYSLGVMMFEMLSGQPPFMADGPGKILGMHMFMEPPLLKDKAPQVPEELAALVQRLLVKNREERPSMREVVAELALLGEKYKLPRPAESAHHEAVMSVDPLRQTEVGPKSTLGSSASQAASQAIAKATRPPKRWRRIALLFATGTLLVLLLGTFLLVRFSPRHARVFERLRQAAQLAAHATDPEPPANPNGPGQQAPGAAQPAAQGAATLQPAPGPSTPVVPVPEPTQEPGATAGTAATGAPSANQPSSPTAQSQTAAQKPPAQKPKPKAPVYKHPVRRVVHTVWRKAYRRHR